MIILGLLIIAIGAFFQSSCYVPINKIRSWSWESYWIVQGVFAWLVLPFLFALLAVPEGHSLFELFTKDTNATLWTIFYGMLWGVGGLTFGLSMRYLGVALGQSISLGTCAGLGTLLAPIFTGHAADLTTSVVWGVVVTLVGIGIIGVAGSMKASQISKPKNADKEAAKADAQEAKEGESEAKDEAVKDFNFTKGIIVALVAGFMSACFNIGLSQGADLRFDGVAEIYASLPATFLVTFGGFLTNAVYCLYQNGKNKSFSDYRKGNVWANNLVFCLLAGALWYSQFFGLAIGKGFLTASPVLLTFSFCILMALNVVFSNLWGIILKEWKGCSKRTICVLILGLAVLIVSSFLPQLI